MKVLVLLACAVVSVVCCELRNSLPFDLIKNGVKHSPSGYPEYVSVDQETKSMSRKIFSDYTIQQIIVHPPFNFHELVGLRENSRDTQYIFGPKYFPALSPRVNFVATLHHLKVGRSFPVVLHSEVKYVHASLFGWRKFMQSKREIRPLLINSGSSGNLKGFLCYPQGVTSLVSRGLRLKNSPTNQYDAKNTHPKGEVRHVGSLPLSRQVAPIGSPLFYFLIGGFSLILCAGVYVWWRHKHPSGYLLAMGGLVWIVSLLAGWI